MITKNTEKIINSFLEKFINDHSKDSIKIEGVLIFGSYVNKKNISHRSDLDLFILIKNNRKRYRGVSIIDNVPIDYFINPYEQIKADFKKAKTSSKKTTILMMAKGIILKDKNNRLVNLQKQAKNYLKKSASKPSKVWNDLTKYHIQDYLDDLEDCYDSKDDFSFYFVLDSLSDYLIEIMTVHYGLPPEKPKYYKEMLERENKDFIKRYSKLKKAKNKFEKKSAAKHLADLVFNILGGKLSSDWEIISPTDC